jgi:hypothetical protein
VLVELEKLKLLPWFIDELGERMKVFCPMFGVICGLVGWDSL